MTAAVLIISLAIALSDTASVARVTFDASSSSGPKDLCDSQVYCEGPLLHTVQLAGIFDDSKTFVDLYQLNDPDVTIKNFNALMITTNNSPNRSEVAAFVENNFAMQNELDNSTLPDWKENPSFLKRIDDPLYRQWAGRLNSIWKTLARKIKHDLVVNPQRHSLIYVNNTFIIPGGRFKEFYYWDSYWIIKGLLICEMPDTARGMIENFLSMVDRFGFVPNGGRVYYLSRSQPPLLIPMVEQYYRSTRDRKFLKNNIVLLEKEFAYWLNEKTVDVTKDGRTYKMAHYVVNSRGPRPESYKEDYQLAQQVPEEKQGALYNDLKAAAESGFDFSYRWCIQTNKNAKLSLLNVSTSDIIPVDLNAMLERNARMLADFYRTLYKMDPKTYNRKKILYYIKIASDFQVAIDEVLWNPAVGIWLDYDMKNKKHRNEFYPSNLTPLYTESYDERRTKSYAKKAVSYLKKNHVEEFFGGTPTSLNHTGEQWDFPNAWPPLQSILILGLDKTGTSEAVKLANTLANRWLRANHMGYDEYGKMFEKYNALHPGESGGGGEYGVQEGFGWTNGVVIELLRLFPNAKSEDKYR